MTQPKTDPVAVYETAVEQARKIMTGVKPDQMKDSTPCAEWDVAALLDHMTKAQASIGGIIAGSPVAPGATPLETLDCRSLGDARSGEGARGTGEEGAGKTG